MIGLDALGERFEVEVGVELTKRGKVILDKRGADILLAIKETGSLTEATKKTGLSYKGLWICVKRIEESLGNPVVQTITGGREGGASALTVLGESILQDYLILSNRIKDIVEAEAKKPPDVVVIGSHCPALELLVSSMRRKDPHLAIKVLNAGSEGGIEAMKRGLSDVCGLHILDSSTHEYNLPILERAGCSSRAMYVRGYRRVQGLMTAKGNPKSIEDVGDLTRRDVVFINRNAGSGTRTLLDVLLEEQASKLGLSGRREIASRIRGYKVEVRSHTEVAIAVADRRVDVGMGLQSSAAQYGLSFIPLARENYDFAVRKDRLESRTVRAFLRELRSTEFHKLVTKNLPGIECLPETGHILSR